MTGLTLPVNKADGSGKGGGLGSDRGREPPLTEPGLDESIATWTESAGAFRAGSSRQTGGRAARCGGYACEHPAVEPVAGEGPQAGRAMGDAGSHTALA